MKYINKHVNNISGLQFFQLLRFGTLFLIGILFAKSNLSPKDIGTYETLVFIAGGVSFFWVSGFLQSFISLFNNNNTFKENKTEKSPEIFNTSLIFLFFSICAFLFVFFFKNYIAKVFVQNENIPYVNYLLWYILLSNLGFLIEYIYLVKNKPKKIIIYGGLTFFVQFLIVGFPPLLGYGIEVCLLGLIGISIVRLIWLFILVLKYSSFKFSFTYIKEHISIGLPLVLSVFLSGSAQYIDGIIISNRYDETVFAVFRYGARELPIVVLLANAFSNAMLPVFSKTNNLKQALLTIKSKSKRLMHFLFPITILLILTSNYFYPIIFNSNFSESAGVFNVYLLLIVSRLVFPQTILIGLKKTKFILFVTVIELVINVVLSLILIKYFEIIGVAIATVIAFFIEKLILIIFNYKYLKIKPSKYIPIPWHIFYSLITVFIYLIIEFNILHY